MFLKSIELFGFKSFADRTRIEFAPGISALLGPNGCGKSNVVDAIKWVLGEQGTKALRADRMEDVIFNGTEARRAVSVAEVTLTMGNEDGLLPLDVTEIAVRRRLYRNGESEYAVNGRSAKLRDIRELFFDTGVGKSAYSIMEQGRIDQVLSNKPEERRGLFEEAAGITKYKARRAEAERKLERTEENMRRVAGILGEVKRSYSSLEKQAERAERYRKLREATFELDRDVHLLKLRALLEEEHKRKEQLEKRVAQRDELRAKIDGANTDVESGLDEVNKLEEELNTIQRELYRLELERTNRRETIRMVRERKRELEEAIEARRVEQTRVTERIERLRGEQASYAEELASIVAQQEESAKNIASFEEHINEARRRIQADQRSISENEAAIKSLESEERELALQLRELTDRIVTELDAGLRSVGYTSEKRDALDQALTEKLESLRIAVDGRHARLTDAAATQTDAGPEDDFVSRVAKTVEALGEAWHEYRSTVPTFLDDFVSPEGIVTQKRRIDDRTDAIHEEVGRRRDEVTRLREEIASLQTKLEEYRRTLEELRVNAATLAARRQSAEAALKRTADAEKEQQRVSQRLREEDAADAGKAAEFDRRIEEASKANEESDAASTQLRTRATKLEETIQARNRKMKEGEARVKRWMVELAKLQEQAEQAHVVLAQVRTEISGTFEGFQERHSQDLREWESRAYEIRESAADLRKTLADRREELRNLGSVNLMAPEEFKEVKERFDFLSGQIADLEKARSDLHKVTEEINRESTELFTETFARIRRNFHSVFRRLFGGGRAELRLIDSEDALTAGVDVFAQPPGKRLENIALLSGGERALTGVALLFATYMVKPSPFCVLDEIDAALDEANVGRFVSMLTEFGKASQFIVITHNKKTVAGAQSLLGVTMEESGVSRVVAIRLAEAEGRDAIAPTDGDDPDEAPEAGEDAAEDGEDAAEDGEDAAEDGAPSGDGGDDRGS